MQILQLSTVEVVLTPEELESYYEKFGLLGVDSFTHSIFIPANRHFSEYLSQKIDTFFGGVDANKGIYVDLAKCEIKNENKS